MPHMPVWHVIILSFLLSLLLLFSMVATSAVKGSGWAGFEEVAPGASERRPKEQLGRSAWRRWDSIFGDLGWRWWPDLGKMAAVVVGRLQGVK